MFPLQIARNAVGKAVSIDLQNGECINGTVSRSDMMMNIVLRNAIRCGTSGEVFWSAKEALVRGTSIVSMRLDPEALNTPAFLLRGRGRGAASGGRGGRGGRGGNATASTGDDADSRRGRGAGRGRGRGGDRGRGGRGGSGRGNGRGRGGATKRPRES